MLPRYARMPPGVPSLIYMHVGKRLRQRRSLLDLSQEKLEKAVGDTFQQIQKYECGANRIGASRLYQFAIILAVSIAYFFETCQATLKPMVCLKRWGFLRMPNLVSQPTPWRAAKH